MMQHRPRNAISQAISHGADQMCRRSIELRRYVAMITGKPMVKDCPACPYKTCVIPEDKLVERKDVAAIRQQRAAPRPSQH